MSIYKDTMKRHNKSYSYYRNSVNGQFASYNELNNKQFNNSCNHVKTIFIYILTITGIYIVKNIIKKKKYTSLESEYSSLELEYNNTESEYSSLELEYNNAESEYSSLELEYNNNEFKKCA